LFDFKREQVRSGAAERDKIENDLLKQDRFLRETILNSALTRNRQFFSNDDLMESIGLDSGGRLLVPVSALPVNLEQSPLAYAIQAPYAEVTLGMMLEDALGERAEGRPFYKTTVELAVVFVFFVRTEELQPFYRDIQRIMDEVCSLFHKKYSLILDVVIGNGAPSLDLLFPRYQEMRAAHMIGVISGEHRVIRSPETQVPPGNGNLLTGEYAQLLSEAIERRSMDDAYRITNDYFLRLGESGCPFHIFRYHVYSLVSMLVDLLPPSVRESGQFALKEVLDAIASEGSQAQLRQSLQRFIRLFRPGGETDRESSGVFPRINGFVMEHYSDINLSLTMIAGNIGLSVKYISKLFKIETGQGLLSYIGSVRIKKARELLDGGRYSLNEISWMVGYSSVKTFRRVFQKIAGVKPSEYRSLHRRD
jgi:AraC-like DNA-binding protein